MSKKKVGDRRKKEQNRRLLYIGICAVLFVILIVIIAYARLQTTQDSGKLWSLDSLDKLSFTGRDSVQGYANQTENGTNYTVEKVVYKSFGDDVYALLRIPKNVTKPPVVIVIPAANITKEQDEPMAEALSGMGYASLTLDKRGWGETGGPIEGDFYTGQQEFNNGGDPVQYKQVYDALKALDYVKSRPDLDGNDVAILGESRGAVWAIVAAGIEPQFKGVVTVSGFDMGKPDNNDAKAIEFINSLTPSRYLANIPPRKLVMIQFTDDQVISADQGKALYENASEPKEWYLYNGTTHGLYDKAYAADLQKELKGMLGR